MLRFCKGEHLLTFKYQAAPLKHASAAQHDNSIVCRAIVSLFLFSLIYGFVLSHAVGDPCLFQLSDSQRTSHGLTAVHDPHYFLVRRHVYNWEYYLIDHKQHCQYYKYHCRVIQMVIWVFLGQAVTHVRHPYCFYQ